MNPALAGSANIQTESEKMTEKSTTEPQNQTPALAMTDEQFAKARSGLIWWCTRLMIGLP
jgi:hypothetical protein